MRPVVILSMTGPFAPCFAPGRDAETAFRNDFIKAGGNIAGGMRVPLKNPDFAPFLQRIKDAKPDAVFTFLPPGGHTLGFMRGFMRSFMRSFMRGFIDRGLREAGIRVIATGDLTDDDMLEAIGDAAPGQGIARSVACVRPPVLF